LGDGWWEQKTTRTEKVERILSVTGLIMEGLMRW